MTLKQVETEMDKIIQANKENNNTDWMLELIIAKKSKNEVFKDYYSTVQRYYYYLKNAVKYENYELSAKIMTCLDIEEKWFIKLIKEYTKWIEEDKKLMSKIKAVRKEYNKLYLETL